MSGYRRVNFYELCRLCTSSEGLKTHIFREEGRRLQLPTKIQSCLPLQITEEDSLPKTVCNLCLNKIEDITSFRQSAVNAEAMLETYFTSLRCSDEYRRSEGKVSSVYVKESNSDLDQIVQEEQRQQQQEQTPPPPPPPLQRLQQIQQQPPQQQQQHHQQQQIQSQQHIQLQQQQQQQHSPNKSESHIVSMMGDSVIQVVKADQISKHQHVQHMQQHNSVVTSVATASSTSVQQRPTINFVDNQNGTKTITLPVNVSQSPLKMTSGNTMVLPVSMEGLQSLVQAGASVQIVQQNEVDGSTRLQSYRYVQLPTSQGPATVALVPSSDPRFTFVDQSQVRSSSVSSMPEDEQHEVIAVHPHETEEDEEEEEMQYVQFSGYNNKDNRDERNISNISEFLKIKTLVESPPHSSQEEPMDDVEGESVAMCGNCGKMLMSNEEMTHHISTCSSTSPHSGHNGVLVQSNSQDIKPGELGEDPDLGGDGVNDPNAELPLSYPCDLCNKAFRRKEHLFQHKKLHTGERPFICGTCGKAFSRKEHLLRHGTSHTGQKMHPCDICGKMFSRKDNLHKHRKTHGITGPYVCDYCGKSFVVKHYYTMHIANRGCPESKEAAASAAGGDGSAPAPFQYRCDICFKTFVSAEFLKTHKGRHRNRKNVQVIQRNNSSSSSGGGTTQDENQRNNSNNSTETYTVSRVNRGPRQQQQQQQQQHQQEQQQDTTTAVIMESQDNTTTTTTTIVLKQEIDMMPDEDPDQTDDPLSVEQHHSTLQSEHHTLSTLTSASLIPTTMGTHVIQIPSSYIESQSTDGTLQLDIVQSHVRKTSQASSS